MEFINIFMLLFQNKSHVINNKLNTKFYYVLFKKIYIHYIIKILNNNIIIYQYFLRKINFFNKKLDYIY